MRPSIAEPTEAAAAMVDLAQLAEQQLLKQLLLKQQCKSSKPVFPARQCAPYDILNLL